MRIFWIKCLTFSHQIAHKSPEARLPGFGANHSSRLIFIRKRSKACRRIWDYHQNMTSTTLLDWDSAVAWTNGRGWQFGTCPYSITFILKTDQILCQLWSYQPLFTEKGQCIYQVGRDTLGSSKDADNLVLDPLWNATGGKEHVSPMCGGAGPVLMPKKVGSWKFRQIGQGLGQIFLKVVQNNEKHPKQHPISMGKHRHQSFGHGH